MFLGLLNEYEDCLYETTYLSQGSKYMVSSGVVRPLPTYMCNANSHGNSTFHGAP